MAAINYNDNGTAKKVTLKSGDTLPVGTRVKYSGDIVPAGYREVEDDIVNTLEGNETDKAPSVHIIKNNIKNVIGNASDTNNGLMSSDFYKKNQLTNIWLSGGSSHNLTINDYATIIAFGTYDSKNFIWVLRLDPNTISTVFSYGTLPSNWTRTSKGLNIPSASNTNVNLIGQIKSYI